jgi:hydrogenase-4 component B
VPWLGAGVMLIVAGAVLALALGSFPRLSDGLFRSLVLAGCGLAAVPAVGVLLGTGLPAVSFGTTLPGGRWHYGMDPLSAWFTLLLCIVAAATVGYGVTYLAPERAHRRIGAPHALFALLVASMAGVFAARAAVPFLLAWELMAVSAYFLIVFEHDRPGVRGAGMVYLVLTHAGTLALLGMFLAWGRSAPDLSFAHLTPAAARAIGGGIPILLLALFGFGVKAGIFPFHFWLPAAHAAAPSHVSALLSGVMIKTGVYGLFRVLSLLGAPPPWWAWTVLLLGLASAVLGVLWALTQRDLKRALAYSSVDNIGIIFLGLGLGALGNAYHQPVLAVLGFAGALLHALNHALFKSLLFLGAGAVVRSTGTREIDRLGGLASAMPRTAAAFLIGSIAIVGLPALNGFIGEWTLVRGFLAAGGSTGPFRLAGLGAAALGLIGALTLACFVRLGTTVFLGTPRDPDALPTDDAPGGIGAGLALLGGACLVIGLLPVVAMTPVLGIAGTLAESQAAVALSPFGGFSPWAVTALVLGLGLLSAIVWSIRQGAGRGMVRSSVTWACGYPASTSRMQSTAESFSVPLWRAFSSRALPPSGELPGGIAPGRDDFVLRGIAAPAWKRIRRLGAELRLLQQGRVTTYLQYIIGTVVLLLGYLFFAGKGSAP